MAVGVWCSTWATGWWQDGQARPVRFSVQGIGGVSTAPEHAKLTHYRLG